MLGALGKLPSADSKLANCFQHSIPAWKPGPSVSLQYRRGLVSGQALTDLAQGGGKAVHEPTTATPGDIKW